MIGIKIIVSYIVFSYLMYIKWSDIQI